MKKFQDLENKDIHEKLIDWCNGQFSEYYTPSRANVNDFVCYFLNDMIKYYDMPLNITFDEILQDWEIQEPFNDWFLD